MLNPHKITTRVAAVLSLLLAAPVVSAGPAEHFEMAVIEDIAYGKDIVDGDLDQAIAGIEARSYSKNEAFAVNNNLCVALTMKADFEKAAEVCETAVEVSKSRLSIEKDFGFSVGTRNYAMALTNRGVLRLVTGEKELAKADFELARTMRAGISAPRNNLEYYATRFPTQQASLMN